MLLSGFKPSTSGLQSVCSTAALLNKDAPVNLPYLSLSNHFCTFSVCPQKFVHNRRIEMTIVSSLGARWKSRSKVSSPRSFGGRTTDPPRCKSPADPILISTEEAGKTEEPTTSKTTAVVMVFILSRFYNLYELALAVVLSVFFISNKTSTP